MSKPEVRVRFAPSPTGGFHVGGARTALYNYLYARHTGGSFILRIEDTDRVRLEEDSLADHMHGLRWLGIEWDEGPEVGGDYGPYVQSERLEEYQWQAEQLVRDGKAYYCFCATERLAHLREDQRRKGLPVGYDRHCRKLTTSQIADYRSQDVVPVVRLRTPLEGVTSFHDVLRGDITVENHTLEDLVLLKSDGFPTYHLAAVVDDHLMEISHILRGDEWLSSVPHRIVLYDAFGWKPPIYVHLPTILDPSGKGKLSKRKKYGPGEKAHPVFVKEFEALGYLPEAMLNYLGRVGWSYDDKTEFFTKDELIHYFDLPGISKSPAVFSYDKLAWMNGVYIRELETEDLARRLEPFLQEAGFEARSSEVCGLVPLIRERMKQLSDGPSLVDFVFADELSYDPKMLIQKKMDAEGTLRALATAETVLGQLDTFDEQILEATLRSLAEELGLKAGQLFGALRVAVTGRKVAPPLFGTLAVLGREKVLARIGRARSVLAAAAD